MMRKGESWGKYAKRTTEPLIKAGVKKGVAVYNTRTNIPAIVSKAVSKSHPYIHVHFRQKQKKGERGMPKLRRTAWLAENVQVLKCSDC